MVTDVLPARLPAEAFALLFGPEGVSQAQLPALAQVVGWSWRVCVCVNVCGRLTDVWRSTCMFVCMIVCVGLFFSHD